MKKIVILVALVLAVSVTAYAQKGPGYGHGGGYGGGYGHGGGYGMGDDNSQYYGDCGMPCGGSGYHNDGGRHGNGQGYHRGGGDYSNAPVITLAEAKTKVAEYIKANYKGYTVKDVKEFKTGRGNAAFTAEVKDASGNEFLFHVTPWGDVRGPMHQNR